MCTRACLKSTLVPPSWSWPSSRHVQPAAVTGVAHVCTGSLITVSLPSPVVRPCVCVCVCRTRVAPVLEAAIEGTGRGNKGRKKTDKASSCIANRAASGVSRSRAHSQQLGPVLRCLRSRRTVDRKRKGEGGRGIWSRRII